ncbi:MAG: hypothetical protein WA635_00465 [Gallionella sp.]
MNHARNGVFAKTRILADLGGPCRTVFPLKTMIQTAEIAVSTLTMVVSLLMPMISQIDASRMLLIVALLGWLTFRSIFRRV